MRSKAVNGRTWRRGWGGSKIQEPGFDSNQEFLESTDSPWPHLSLVFLPVRNHARSGGRCFVRVVASQLLQSEPGSCGCRKQSEGCPAVCSGQGSAPARWTGTRSGRIASPWPESAPRAPPS